jgi:hypothetical protein
MKVWRVSHIPRVPHIHLLPHPHVPPVPSNECRCPVVNTPTSFSGAHGFPTTGYPDLGFPWFISVLPGEFRDSTLKLGHDLFLPNPFQFIIIHLLPYHLRYIV